MSEEKQSHLFAIRTTGGQEKVVMGLLEVKARMNKLNVMSVLLVDGLKGYVVVEVENPNAAYQAVDGHVRPWVHIIKASLYHVDLLVASREDPAGLNMANHIASCMKGSGSNFSGEHYDLLIIDTPTISALSLRCGRI